MGSEMCIRDRLHAYLNQESDISHFITYYIRAFDGYDSQGEQIVRSMTWKPSENLTPKQIEKELQRQVIMFEETVKKGTCLTVTPAFQNMPKSGLKITSPRYLLLKDLAEANLLKCPIYSCIPSMPTEKYT